MIVQRSAHLANQRLNHVLQTGKLLRNSRLLLSTVESSSSDSEKSKIEEITQINKNQTADKNQTVDEKQTAEDQCSDEVKKLNDTISELTEKYKRSLAETENVRTRMRKEISDAKIYGIQSFCKDLLTVADVMRMAVDCIPNEKVTKEDDKTWKSFYEGVCLTDKELHKVFERHGLVALLPAKGEKFNPNEHEALFETPVPDLEPGMIAHVERIGYKLKDRTLRPAQVGVSKK